MDTVGVVFGLAYAGASVVLAFIGPAALAAALLAATGPVAMVSAWAGWRTHRRVWPMLIATAGLAASGAGYLLGIGTVTGTSAAVLGGLSLALAHDANRLLCLRARSVPVPVAILTGFLGSGKTTMLNHVLAQDGMAGTAVIVNELGEVGIDHLLVEHVDERMMYLTSGCLCCTIRGDLIQTLQDVFARMDRGEIPRVDRVLVETTGLADPVPILHALMAPAAATRRYRLASVVATVDAVNGLRTLERHAEAVTQVAVADRVFLTKTDLQGDVEELRVRLRGINPAAPIIEVSHGAVDIAELLDGRMYELPRWPAAVRAWLGEAAYRDSDESTGHGSEDHRGHDHAIRTHCITRQRPIRARTFQKFLALLAAEQGDALLRVKGILHVIERPGTPALIHGVQHVLHPVRWLTRWPDDDRTSRLVFITRGIPRERLERLLDALERSNAAPPSAVRP